MKLIRITYPKLIVTKEKLTYETLTKKPDMNIITFLIIVSGNQNLINKIWMKHNDKKPMPLK